MGRAWAPKTAILAHLAVGAFLAHCGSSSLLEAAAAAGAPMQTWPLVFDRFIEERLVTDVPKIGEKVWGRARSTKEEKEMVPAKAVTLGGGEVLGTRRNGGDGEGPSAGARSEGSRGRVGRRVVL